MRRSMMDAVRFAGRGALLTLLLGGAGIAALAVMERRPWGGISEEAATEAATWPVSGALPLRGGGTAAATRTGGDAAELAALRARLAAEAARLDATREALDAVRAELAILVGLREEVATLRAEMRRPAPPPQGRAELPVLDGAAAAAPGGTASAAPDAPPLPVHLARVAAALGRTTPAVAAAAEPAPPAAATTGAAVTIHRRAGSVAARRAAAQVAEEVRRAGLAVAAVRDEPEVPGERLIRGATPEATRLAARFRERWGHAWQVSEAPPPPPPPQRAASAATTGLEVWLPHR